MAAETSRKEPADSEQDEEEDVYEVERIIDMRVEEGEVLYRVRWKNYCSDDDTWEPEAHLADCSEVLLNFKAKKEAEGKKVVQKVLPTKSINMDADSESDSDKDRPTDIPIKKKKKKKIREYEEEEAHLRVKKKKKKDKERDDLKPLPAPETDEEEERVPSPPSPPSPPKVKKSDSKKRVVDSEEEEEEPVPSKKHKKDKGKEGGKHKKDRGEERKKKKEKKEQKIESSDDEVTAPVEDELSEGPSESQLDDNQDTDTGGKSLGKDKSKQKTAKRELKLQNFKDLIQEKKMSKKLDGATKESSLQKQKNSGSKSKEDVAPQSDSSDSSTLHKKAKSKSQEPTSSSLKVLSSSTSSSSSSSSITAASTTKVKEDEMTKEEVLGPKDASGSTNLFEKFLLNCEAKDRAPRRPQPPQGAPEKSSSGSSSSSKSSKVIGKIEKIPKSSKDSPAQKAESEKTERTKQSDGNRPGQTYGFSLDSDEREEDSVGKQRLGDDLRERRERPEESQRLNSERRTSSDDRRKKREDSEPRLFIACDDVQDPQESADKPVDKSQTTLSLGMDLNLDWMTLDDFQKHLNGEDEILSGPPLSPSELRDAVKTGDYMAVKLALNSKEDYNLDQEDVSGMSLSMLAAAGGQDDILRLLIKKGVRVNGRQKNGTTALMHAAEKNFLTTVAILLEAGSYVNAQTLSGETALMKACKRGNADIVRLLLENGADCNILSKHKTNAIHFAKLSNNLIVCDLIKDHISMLTSVAEDTIRAYFESRLMLLEPIFPMACHRLCEGPDFSLEFGFKPQPHPEGSGVLLFIFHANFLNEITARLCGSCSVHAVVLNDKFQLPIFLDSHFIYSFSPNPGINRLFIRLAEAPAAKVKLLICAYRVQLQ